MQVATAETVLGDFEDVRFEHGGVRSRFFRDEGGRFVVHTDGPDGEMADFAVAYTFGVDPLQQYLIELPGGRLQALGIAWDVAGERWFHLYPDARLSAGDPLHWTGRRQSWNHMCAECHSTNLEKNYDAEADSYATTWTDLDVACEACHGPGSQHVADPTTPMPALADETESCAPCHSRRVSISESDVHGEPFLDHFLPASLDDGLYHPDGQIQGEVYVWGSFVQSRMHARGVRCGDCHDPHTARLRLEGNALCAQCHNAEGTARFPGLTTKVYDGPAHHFHEHEPAMPCVDCHMPSRTYMRVDPRRDHSLRVPRPQLAAPNVCTSCHSERPSRWAVKQLERWYPEGEWRRGHFGEALALARSSAEGAGERLLEVVGTTEQPAIARATALELLGDPVTADREVLDAQLLALRDADPLVRASAVVAALGMLGVIETSAEARSVIEQAAALLSDPRRAVRVEAARAFVGIPLELLKSAERAALERARAEYRAGLVAAGDQPEAQLNLGVLHADEGDAAGAEAAYRAALRLDERFAPARFNLANLLNALGRNDEALAELDLGLELTPRNGEAHYSRGLLLAEMRRMPEAVEALAEAARLVPSRPRVLGAPLS